MKDLDYTRSVLLIISPAILINGPNVAKSNYSSAKLFHQIFKKSLKHSKSVEI